MIKQSKNWDMDISFEELIKNKILCVIDNKYNSHWSDDGNSSKALLMNHPNSEKNNYCIITASKEGCHYDGNVVVDYETLKKDERYLIIQIERGLKKLEESIKEV